MLPKETGSDRSIHKVEFTIQNYWDGRYERRMGDMCDGTNTDSVGQIETVLVSRDSSMDGDKP